MAKNNERKSKFLITEQKLKFTQKLDKVFQQLMLTLKQLMVQHAIRDRADCT